MQAWKMVIVVVLACACGPTAAVDECEGNLRACDEVCVDTGSDPANCGGCGVVCDTAAGWACLLGTCVGPPECTPAETRSCYSGASGTQDVGPCHAGTQTCDPSAHWGSCADEVVPTSELCGNTIDDNCSGETDEENDIDGDGFTNCNGDCCNTAAEGCSDPALVNPGAFEVGGNMLDDDCDGVIDNPAAADCDVGLASNSGDPLDYARAIDLCQMASETDGRWGLITASLGLSDGSDTPANASRSLRTGFGGATVRFGSSLAVLSTGHAADMADASPAYAAFQVGEDMGTEADMPADWLAANGGTVPNAPGCPDPAGDKGNDSVMLTLRVRAPTNARSFSLSINFFSSEYPEWVCSPFNDFFVVLLDSVYAGDPANPADKNLATYTAPGGELYPVGVNLAYGNTGLFRECKNGPTGCTGLSVPGDTTSCTGLTELTGTGFDVANPPSVPGPGSAGWCGESNLAGGGTGWLLTSGNVVGGEIFELRLAIWDTSDHIYDSVVLLDNFQWSVDAAQPGTIIE